jgi:hypothetical protein
MAFEFAQADNEFRIFDHIDSVIVSKHNREERVSREPRVWPSAASVEPFDQSVHKIEGKCGRQVFYGWTAEENDGRIDAKASWKFEAGNLLEAALTELAATPRKTLVPQPDGSVQEETISIKVASGVRIFVEDILLSFELDLVVINPNNNRAIIVENKTFSSKNYTKQKEILKEGKPAISNLLQVLIYLFEIRTGARLKQAILKGLAERQQKDAKKAELEARGLTYEHHNRIEVVMENFEKLDDGPLTAKLTYLDRSDGLTQEFDISIERDEVDGMHYPVIGYHGAIGYERKVWKDFPIESIYARFRALQQYYRKAKEEAEKLLASQGVLPPEQPDDIFSTPEERAQFREDDKEYWSKLAETMRTLPDNFLPPPEYELSYSPEKIEMMWAKGLIAKTRYEGWKKKHKGKENIGDWQCTFCDYRRACVSRTRPDLVYLIQDINAAVDAEVSAA